MQRHKAELIKRGEWVEDGRLVHFVQPTVEKYSPAWERRQRVNGFGKFVYGANCTLTQAARWRAQSILLQSKARELFGAVDYHARSLAAESRSILESSREGGCRLPS